MKIKAAGVVVGSAVLVSGLTAFAGSSGDETGEQTRLVGQAVQVEQAAQVEQTAAARPKGSTAPKGYKLVWRDEFKGTKLAQDWSVQPALTGLRPCTTTLRKAAVVRGGKVRISASRDTTRPKSAACPKGWFGNGQFTTEKSHLFKYGYFEARVKVQRESGMHGGWFLYQLPEPEPGVDPRTPKALGIEMDALEYFGDRDDKAGFTGAVQNSIYHFTVRPDGSLKLNKLGGRQNVRKVIGKKAKPSDAFHVYSVEWTPKAIIFRMDGKVTFRHDANLSTRKHYLFLSMLTSPFEAQLLRPRELPGTMQVDWVRVWKKK